MNRWIRQLGFGRRGVAGEPLAAIGGLALVCALLLGLGVVGFWGASEGRSWSRDSVVGEAEAAATVLSRGASTMLAGGDVEGLRRVVGESGRDGRFRGVRVKLSDGQVVADSSMGGFGDGLGLPEHWEGSAGSAGVERDGSGGFVVRMPVTVEGRGSAVVEVSGVEGATASAWFFVAGWVGLVGALGCVGLMVVYLRTRGGGAGLHAVRAALRGCVDEGVDHGQLTIAERFGDEARAWNGLLEELRSLRGEAVAEKAEAELSSRRQARGELHDACDAMWQGLLVVDDRLRVKYANGAAAIFLRTKRDALCGQDVREVLTDERVVGPLSEVVSGTTKQRTTVEIETGEENRGVLRVSIRPVRREDSAAAMVMIEDVTQQRVAEEARNAFVAQATHELRTPLTNIRLYVEEAVEVGDEDAATRAKCLNVINQETRRLERIVGDMLSVSEIEAGSFRLRVGEVRLDALFDELEADYRASADEKRITLAFDLPPKIPVIRGDRDKLVLAVHNLLGNAIKYTPEGGAVTVVVEADESCLKVEVRDTGIGIGEEDAARIFERFYRAQDKRVADVTGTGLGLTLARDVVRLHGGDITLQSEVDKGSTFTLVVPSVPGAGQEAATPAKAA